MWAYRAHLQQVAVNAGASAPALSVGASPAQYHVNSGPAAQIRRQQSFTATAASGGYTLTGTAANFTPTSTHLIAIGSAGSYALTGTTATVVAPVVAMGIPTLCMTPNNTGGTGSKTYTLTTTAGYMVMVYAGVEYSTADPAITVLTDTAGWTWFPQFDETYATGANPRLRGMVWTAISDGTSNDVTVTHGNGVGQTIGMTAVQVSGADTTLINYIADKDPAGGPSVTYENTVTGMSFAFVQAAQSNPITPQAGMSEITDVAYTSNSGRIAAYYDLTAPALGQTWSSSNLYTMAMAFELQVATASLTASAGSYALTGTSATTRKGLRATAGTSSYALTGTAATLRQAHKLSVDAGSYAITGTDATIRKGLKLSLDAGSYALTGTDATTLWKRKLAAGTSSYALTGSAAGITIPLVLGTPTLCMTPDNTGGLGSKTYTLTTTSGYMVIVFAGAKFSSADPAQPTISDTAGWTWTPQFDETYSTGVNPRLRGRIWTATSNGSSNDVTVTHGNGGSNVIGMLAVQVANASGTLTNYDEGKDAAGDPAITYPNAFASGSISAAFVFTGNGNQFTAGSGMTEVSDVAAASSGSRFWYGHDLTSPGSTQSWTSTNLYSMAMAFEIGLNGTGNKTLTATSPGSYALTGTAATLRQTHKLSADDVGSYSIDGVGAAIALASQTVLVPEAGSYALTGSSAALDIVAAPTEVATRGGGIGFEGGQERQRRKFRHVTKKRLEELLFSKDEEKAPEPTPEAIEAIQEEVIYETGLGLLGPQQERRIREEISLAYKSSMDWAALTAAIEQVQREAAARQAAYLEERQAALRAFNEQMRLDKIERDLDEEDELILGMH